MVQEINIDRRTVLRAGAVAAVGVGTAGCASVTRRGFEEVQQSGSGGNGGSGGSGTNLRSISVGETKEGFVDTGDGTDPVYDDVAEPVSLALESGSAVTITMESDAMDCYLLLTGPNGGAVAENDDGAAGYDSRITWNAATAGTYTVWAGSLGGDATGAYTLSVTEVGSTGTDESDQSTGGQDLRTIAYGETKGGFVDAADGRDPSYDDVAEPVRFEGESGDRVAVTMESEAMDTYLLVTDPNGAVVAENDDGASGVNSRVEATLAVDGTYTIWAGSLGGDATGAYTLSLAKVGESSGSGSSGGSSDLRSISYGQTRQGYVDSGDGLDPVYDDLAEPVQFAGGDGDRIAVTMESSAMDCYLIVTGPNGTVVGEDDDGAGGLDSRIEATLSASGTYTVWAGSLTGDATGSYTLTLERV